MQYHVLIKVAVDADLRCNISHEPDIVDDRNKHGINLFVAVRNSNRFNECRFEGGYQMELPGQFE